MKNFCCRNGESVTSPPITFAGGGKISRQIQRRAGNFIAAIKTNKRAVCFRRKICGDDLAGEFLFGAEHWGKFYHTLELTLEP